jgi:hypothetical protein
MDGKQELEDLKSEFRTKRLRMYEEQQGAFSSEQEMLAFAKRLYEFCVTGGQDLEELNAFMMQVEEDFQSQIPK